MKRFKTLTLVFAVAALVSAYGFADDEVTTQTPDTTPAFVDDDGDGVCDNYQSGGQGLGQGRGNKSNFVDADGDGVCDNESGQRKGKGQGRGANRNANFVDADGDGVCDNNAEGTQKIRSRSGKGKGRGRK